MGPFRPALRALRGRCRVAPGRLATALLVGLPAVTSCECSGAADGSTDPGGGLATTLPDGGSGGGSIVDPAECAWEPGERPTAELPDAHSNEYVIELARWEIDNARGDPVETRSRMNEAIRWATDNGYDEVVVPAGTYLVGEPTNDVYAAGIELAANMTFELSEGAVIEMAPNDRWNYCVISVEGQSNITIRGGELVGDRASHDYAGGAHDEGHGICVWTSVDRILVEEMEIHEMTGDGVLIVGSVGSEETEEAPSTNVTLRNNDIHHNRRQAVSIVGGHHVVIEHNHLHHIGGTPPSFGIDIEGAGRTDRDILIYDNRFDHNAGGDFVTSSGHNVWVEGNTMIQCQIDAAGAFDPALPCELEEQVDGPIILWKETDNVVTNNTIRMSMPTVNGRWGILAYSAADGPTRENPVGNLVAGNRLFDAGIHLSHDTRSVVADNTIEEGTLLGYLLRCARLENNRIHRTSGESYKLRNVAGLAKGNLLNQGEGAPPEEDVEVHFPMADDAPYRNSSPVYW